MIILGLTAWIGLLIYQDFQIKQAIKEGGGISVQARHETAPYPTFLYFEVKPGERAESSFVLRNGYDKATDLNISATDATGNIDDLKIYEIIEKEDSTQYEAFGKWATFENAKNTDQFTINAKQIKEIPFSIDIPTDTPVGFYWGALFTRNKVTDNPDNNVNIEIRTVLKTLIQVTNTPRPQEELWAKQPNSKIPRIYLLLSGLITGFAIILILGAQSIPSKK